MLQLFFSGAKNSAHRHILEWQKVKKKVSPRRALQKGFTRLKSMSFVGLHLDPHQRLLKNSAHRHILEWQKVKKKVSPRRALQKGFTRLKSMSFVGLHLDPHQRLLSRPLNPTPWWTSPPYASQLPISPFFSQGLHNFYHLSVICDKENVEVDIEDLTLQYDDCMMPYWIP